MKANNNNAYWKKQISSAKDEHKQFFQEAKACNDAYSKERSYNIFYSNTQVLNANLLANTPKPDIQRRFLKKTESDKLKYNTYLEVSKIAEGCINYYSDINDYISSFKSSVFNSVKVGRGVDWIEYTPTIEKNEMGEQVISKRELEVIPLNYQEFLCSNAETEKDVWWVARRHLLTKKEIEDRFNYKFSDDLQELNFTDGEKETQTSQKRGEIWEIWDKSRKERHFILINSQGSDTLETKKDPYELTSFFPCVFDLTWLNNGKNIIPIPEYKVYRQKATDLNAISQSSDNLERAIKYIVTSSGASKDNASAYANAEEGDMIEIKQSNPQQENLATAIGTVPIDGAVNLANHREIKKGQLQQDIYDITGISDLMRGVTDSKDTATAQKIKGVFGSLRFQERQKKVQNHIKKVYQIITEILCEHWDAETMSEITCTYLPTEEEKQAIQVKLNAFNIAKQTPQGQELIKSGQIQQPTQEEADLLNQPTWGNILEVMRSDKLRSYTIDIETTATVFDDMVVQNASIQDLNNTYKEVVATAMQYQDPTIIKGFIPIARMMLTNIKAGRAMGRELIETLDSAVKELEMAQQQAKQTASQQPNVEAMRMQLEQQKLQLEAQDKQSLIQERQAKAQADLVNAQNKQKELALKEIEARAKLNLEQTKVQQDGMQVTADIAQDNRDLDIKQQEADRKQRELDYQVLFRGSQMVQGQEVNPNLAGDVNSLV